MAHEMSRLTGAVEIVGKHPRRLLLAVDPEGFGETVVVEGEDRHRQEGRICGPCRTDRQGADREPGRPRTGAPLQAPRRQRMMAWLNDGGGPGPPRNAAVVAAPCQAPSTVPPSPVEASS